MAISLISVRSSSADTVQLEAGGAGLVAAGDFALVFAGRPNINGPGIPAGWNDLGVVSGSSGGSVHGQRAGWKILTADDVTANSVGTWSSANVVLVLVYRGASGVGAHSGTGGAADVITFPAQSGLAATSWVVAGASHRTATDVRNISATSYTNRTSGAASTIVGGMDTNGAVTSVAERTYTVNASSGNVGRTVEITATPDAIQATRSMHQFRMRRVA